MTSILIHGAIALLWVLLFARAFVLNGLLAWSVGVVYVSYDTALLAFVFWQTFGLAKTTAKPRSAGAAPVTLGVIVAAHNEAAVLPLTLAALFDQSEPPELIVIADDGSTDGTAALLQRQFGLVEPPLGALSSASSTHPSLHWLRLSHQGKPSALNKAMQLVDTEMVLTVDADTLLEQNAISAMRSAFAADPKLVAATGILTPVCGPSLSGRWFQWFQTYEYIRNFLSRYAWMQIDSLLLISGAFAAFRRQAVVEVGGFDPACLVEDYELIHRLRRYSVLNHRGWTTSVVGASRALTDAPGSVGAFLRQRRRWFGGFLQTQYWYRDMVGNRAFGWLGLLMLPVKAADTLQPIYGLTAFALLLVYLVTDRFVLVNPVIGVIGLKILVDFAFHLWSIHLYRRWAAPSVRISFASGLLAALLEPFSFQILRHLGAAWGWGMFLTGVRQWGVQHRLGLVAAPSDMRARARGISARRPGQSAPNQTCFQKAMTGKTAMQIQRYTRTAMAFHWLIALLILANVAMIWIVGYLPDGMVRPVIDTHKSVGITVLGLAILRVLWRATHPAPPLPPSYSAWERWSAHAAHWVLYALIFCLPLSGWAHDSAWKEAAAHPMYLYGLAPWPRIGWLTAIDPADKDYWHDLLFQVHSSFAYVLYAMVVVHVVGAVKHQWLDKQPEFQRMLPGSGAE